MFLETICLKNGRILNIASHNERMLKTASYFGFKAPELPDIEALLTDSFNNKLPVNFEENLRKKNNLDIHNYIYYDSNLTYNVLFESKIKCRVIYHNEIKSISFEKYTPKKIQSLKLVKESPDYAFKFSNRNELENLLKLKDECDDILIVRSGLITDTSYSNVLFSKGNKYFTPKLPLLNGTKRQLLLSNGIINEAQISVDSINDYDRVWLINALLDIEDKISIPVNQIFF